MDAYLDDLAEDLQKLDSIDLALHNLEPDQELHVALMQLETEDIQKLTDRLRGALALGSSVNPIIFQRLLGPLTQKISEEFNDHPFRFNDDRGRILLRPDGSSMDPQFSLKVLEDVNTTVAENPGPAELIFTTGAYVYVAEGVRSIRDDIVITSGISVVLVLLVLMVGLRSVRAPLVVFPPLVLANLINIALLWLLIGEVTIYTSMATAVLIDWGSTSRST